MRRVYGALLVAMLVVWHTESRDGVTRRNFQTPGTTEEHKRQETPTFNPIDCRLTSQTKHQALSVALETHNTN